MCLNKAMLQARQLKMCCKAQSALFRVQRPIPPHLVLKSVTAAPPPAASSPTHA